MSAKVKRIDKKDEKESIEEMFHTLYVMITEMDKKLCYARDSLVASCAAASKKYLTANGVMQAIDFTLQVEGKGRVLTEAEMIDCASIAREMSSIAEQMGVTAQSIPWDEMDTLCDGFYQDDYASNGDITTRSLVRELMVLQLCQNAGSAAADIYEANERMNEEIDKQENAIEAVDPEWLVKYQEYVDSLDETADE